MKVVPSFVYLGVLLHWFLSAIAAGKDRDTTGLKAFGSISAPLNKAPFLPLYRTLEIAESTVGGAFLHGAELWGAFVSLFSLSVPRESSGWLLGFGSKPRADRLLGYYSILVVYIVNVVYVVYVLYTVYLLIYSIEYV